MLYYTTQSLIPEGVVLMKLSKLLSLGTAFSLLVTSLSMPVMAVEPDPNEPSFSVYSPLHHH